MARHSPSSYLFRIGAAILIAAIALAPRSAFATVVTSAGNIPYSGISPGGVNMATGELILVMRPDLAIDGPFPLVFRRYYASMLAREGLASGHMGPNWLGTYDWSLAVVGSNATLVTNRGAAFQFTHSPVGTWDLVGPTYAKLRMEEEEASYEITNPLDRRVYVFDKTSHLLTQIFDEHGNSVSLLYTTGRLTQVSDGLGRTLQFGYDPTGLLTMVSDGTRSAHYAYTGGVLTSAMDAGGQTWTYTYSQPGPQQGLLTGVTEPLGNTPVTQMYDPLGRVMSQTDALGGMAMYAYDAPSGNAFTDPLGNMWTFLHDTQNRLSTLTDPAGGPTSFAYDAPGRPSMVTRPMGDMTSFLYDPASGYLSTLARADGTAIHWGYGSHLVAGATLFDLSTALYPDGATESYGRDAAGNLTDYTDRGGFHWTGTYNSRGQILTATNPSGGVTTFTYDPQGRPATEMDNAGNTTQFAFDALHRLTQTTWPDATHQSYAYDALDHPTSFTDERDKVWGYAYDANGRLMTETDPLLQASGLVYDSMDRVVQDVDPLGHARVYAFDPAGRLQSLTDRSHRITIYGHDSFGHTTGVTDPANGTYSFFYDADGRMTSAQDPLGHAAIIGHDFLDQVTHVTDPVGTGFDYAYDTMGRLTSESDPVNATEAFGYDSRGLLNLARKFTVEIDQAHTSLGDVSQLTDPNRNVWPTAHDPQGRPTSDADPLGRSTTYGYDSRSRPVLIGRPDGTVEHLTYYASGPLRITGPFDGDFSNTSVNYIIDDANRLTGGTGASFAYDAAGRMINSNGFTMTYDEEGRILSETYAPGKVVSYTYDSRGLPSQVMDWMGGTTSFTYDAAHRLTGITRANGTTVAYAYDATDRLVSSVEQKPPPQTSPLSSIAITRDALGQPTSIDRRQPLMPGVTMPSTTGFTYDAASQTNGFSWDPLGRLLSDGSRTFQWDPLSRLTHYAAGADSPRFSYDGFGQMLTHTLGNQAVQQAWNYGHNPPTNDDTQVNLPTPKTSYNVRGPSGLLLYAVDGTTGARSFYHYDESGNTMFLTNDAGSVVTEYSYTPTGGVAVLGQTGNNPFTWHAAAGVMQIGTSGLFQMGGGIYDATTGRVISGGAYASGNQREDYADACASYWISPDPFDMVAARPPPVGSPFDMVATRPPPNGSWVELNPQPFPPDASVALNPQPFPPAPGSWVSPGPQQSPVNYSGNYSGNYHAPINSPGIYPGDSPGSWTANPAGQTKNSSYHSAPAFEIKDWGFEVTNKSTIGSATGGAGAGKIKFNEFTIKKTTDSASPHFFKNCVAGAHYKSVIINMRKAGGDPSSSGKQYLQFKFGTVFTTKVDWSGPGDEGPEETITFVYGKLGVAYKPQKPDGSSTGGSSSGWSSPSPCAWCVQE